MTVNVLLEFEPEGEEDIWTQELKLSEDTWNVPEQEVSDVFVVTVDGSTGSESVIEILGVVETEDSESEGEVDETVMFIDVNPEGVVYSLERLSPSTPLLSVVKRTL